MCGQCFTQNASLGILQRIQTREKTYKCNECDQDFNTRSALTKHQTVHTEKKSYKCNLCGKELLLQVLSYGSLENSYWRKTI